MSEKKHLYDLPMFGDFLGGDVLINKDVGRLYYGTAVLFLFRFQFLDAFGEVAE